MVEIFQDSRQDDLNERERRLWGRVYDQARLEVARKGAYKPDFLVHDEYMRVLMEQVFLQGNDGEYKRLDALHSALQLGREGYGF